MQEMLISLIKSRGWGLRVYGPADWARVTAENGSPDAAGLCDSRINTILMPKDYDPEVLAHEVGHMVDFERGCPSQILPMHVVWAGIKYLTWACPEKKEYVLSFSGRSEYRQELFAEMYCMWIQGYRKAMPVEWLEIFEGLGIG